MNIIEDMVSDDLQCFGQITLLVAEGGCYLAADVHIGPPGPDIRVPSFRTKRAARMAILARQIPVTVLPRITRVRPSCPDRHPPDASPE